MDQSTNQNTRLLPNIAKIAVLRANAIGDYMFILPALHALRCAYPGAEIVLLGQPWHAGFLAGRPGPVDRVIVVPQAPGVRETAGTADEPEAREAFFAAMQAEHFDLALQLHGGGRNSNPFVLRFGARHTAGLKTPDAAPLERWLPYVYFQPEVMRYVEVAGLVGARADDLTPRLEVTAQDVAESCAAVPSGERPLVALVPGVGDSRRRWPPEKFAAVGDALAAAGAQVVVTGTAGERPLVAKVVAAMHHAAQDLGGRLSLNGMAGLLSRCRLVVGNDSGMVHMGEAVGTATVGVYWCGNLINAGPLTRRRHRVHLSWRLNCAVCGRNCIEDACEHRESFVADVPIAEVAASALDLLD